MNSTSFDLLPCVCGEGALELEVTNLGTWKVEVLKRSCSACGCENIDKAREHAARRRDAEPARASVA